MLASSSTTRTRGATVPATDFSLFGHAEVTTYPSNWTDHAIAGHVLRKGCTIDKYDSNWPRHQRNNHRHRTRRRGLCPEYDRSARSVHGTGWSRLAGRLWTPGGTRWGAGRAWADGPPAQFDR